MPQLLNTIMALEVLTVLSCCQHVSFSSEYFCENFGNGRLVKFKLREGKC